MDLKLEIRRNSDRVIVSDVWKDWDFSLFWWEEGNAACDCNREAFFFQALKEPIPTKTECSEGRYSVRCIDNDTGEVLYDDFKTEAS